MIKVTVELIPYGDETRKETLSEIVISNTYLQEWANYVYEYKGFHRPSMGHTGKVDLEGRVEHFRRDPVLTLLFKVLERITNDYEK